VQDGGLALTLVPARVVPAPPQLGVTLHSPGGWRIELSAPDTELAELLRQLP